MPRTCTVCQHPDRGAIDSDLVNGEPLRTIASRYGTVGRMALQRHKEEHIPSTVAKAQEAGQIALADDLLLSLKQLRDRAYSILEQAEKAGDLKTALMGIREARATIELLAEIEGELDRRPVVNLLVSSEWLTLRTSIVAALRPYPEAALAIAEVISIAGSGVHAHQG